MDRRTLVGAAGAAIVAAALPRTGSTQSKFPDRPIRIIVPYSAGGGGDTLARLLAPRLADRLGTSVVVENRPGAGGNLGTEQGLKSPPDGHTLVAISSSYPCQAVISKLGFDPVADYTPITLISREPGVLIVNPDFPAKSLRELIELAKTRPGAYAYGSAGLGSQAHFNTEHMAHLAGVKLNHIPYKGTSQAFNDMLGGNIHLMFGTPQFVVPFSRSGRTRVIAVAGPERLAALPDAPTFREAGLDFDFIAWNGIVAPRGVPSDVAVRLTAEFDAVLRSREIADRFNADGVRPIGGAADRLSTLIRADIERWREVARIANIKGE